MLARVTCCTFSHMPIKLYSFIFKSFVFFLSQSAFLLSFPAQIKMFLKSCIVFHCSLSWFRVAPCRKWINLKWKDLHLIDEIIRESSYHQSASYTEIACLKSPTSIKFKTKSISSQITFINCTVLLAVSFFGWSCLVYFVVIKCFVILSILLINCD